MSETDLAYYRKRIAEEEERARHARCPATRAAHLGLAALYRKRLENHDQDIAVSRFRQPPTRTVPAGALRRFSFSPVPVRARGVTAGATVKTGSLRAGL